jgi:phytoene dehydrogenase-like protein
MAALVADWDRLRDDLLGPLRFPPHHPVELTRFGLRGLRSAKGFAEGTFAGAPSRALFAGVAAHAMLPLDRASSAAFALVLMASGHAVGWPLARGGSQRIADALAGYFLSLGGEIETARRIEDIAQLPPARAILFDVTPRQLLSIAAGRLPGRYRAALGRFRYGPGVFKLDWALDGPVPWTAAGCTRAATVHLGGDLAEIHASEAATWRGSVSDKPFVIVAQQSLFDPTRAPQGKHTGWAYCHVPHGWRGDMTGAIEAQVERFAPGFCDLILARHVTTPADLQAYDANYIGGDINGGVQDLGQLFTRPVARWNPYSTPADGIFLCSSSTPPGGGVHGMCGYHAALAAIAALKRTPVRSR